MEPRTPFIKDRTLPRTPLHKVGKVSKSHFHHREYGTEGLINKNACFKVGGSVWFGFSEVPSNVVTYGSAMKHLSRSAWQRALALVAGMPQDRPQIRASGLEWEEVPLVSFKHLKTLVH